MLSVEIFQCYQLFENSLTLDRLWCFCFFADGEEREEKKQMREDYH